MKKKNKAKGLIFVISGPSGSGKTTLAEKIVADKILKKKVSRSISLTTRTKRPGERDKKDYFFVSERRFREKLKAKKILEWTKYLGYYYATPKDFIDKHLAKGRHVVLCLDLKGASCVRRQYPGNSVTIFVVPPSLDSLLERITGRCRTKAEEVRRRLELAKKELLAAGDYDYCIVNKDLRRAARQLRGIISKEIACFKNCKE